MEKDSLINVALLILIVGLIVVFGSQILISYQDARYDESILANSNNSNFTYTIPVTLTSEEGITSSSATRLNQTWLEFDGIDDKLDLFDTTTDINGNFSFSIWFNNSGGDADEFQHLLYFGNTNEGVLLLNGTIVFSLENSTNEDNNLTYAMLVNNSEWQHLVVAVNQSGNISIYLNGTIINSTDAGICDAIYSRDLNISSPQAFNGSIDEVRIYNMTINPTVALEIYNSGREYNSSLNDSDIILTLPINENLGDTIYDFSGLGNDKTKSGATWNNDGILVTLTNVVDYTWDTTTGVFTIVNTNYLYNWVSITWGWNYLDSRASDYNVAGDALVGLLEFGNWFDIIVIIGIAGLILGIIFIGFKGSKEESISVNY